MSNNKLRDTCNVGIVDTLLKSHLGVRSCLRLGQRTKVIDKGHATADRSVWRNTMGVTLHIERQ